MKRLNKAQLAALAAGATEAEIAALATAPDPVDAAAGAGTTAAAAVAEPEATGTTAAAAAAEGGDDGDATTAEPAAAAVAAPADQSALVAHLQAQLADKDSALIAAKVEVETFKAQAAAVDGLVSTLRAAIGDRLVALGGSADIAAGYTATNIAAEYSRIDTIFKAQFRVGGVAAVAAPEDKPNAKVAVDPMFSAALENSIVK